MRTGARRSSCNGPVRQRKHFVLWENPTDTKQKTRRSWFRIIYYNIKVTMIMICSVEIYVTQDKHIWQTHHYINCSCIGETKVKQCLFHVTINLGLVNVQSYCIDQSINQSHKSFSLYSILRAWCKTIVTIVTCYIK